MIGAIVGTSLRFRLIVVAAAALVMGIGITQLRSAPVDVLPEFTPPYVEIQTEALGLSAEEVEELVTIPLEQAQLKKHRDQSQGREDEKEAHPDKQPAEVDG